MIAVASQNEIPTKSFVAKAPPPASAAFADPAISVRRIRDALRKLFNFNILFSLENVIRLCTYDASVVTALR